MSTNWRKTVLSKDAKFHVLGDKPFYKNRFNRVLKYHSPGIAPVEDSSGAYHIDQNGKAIYNERYLRTFGFYERCASVVDKQGWKHILPDGTSLYENHYDWCGNFQNRVCTVRDKDGFYLHINKNGKPLYKNRYKYAGDFKDTIACVQNNKGFYTHIYLDGTEVHRHWFLDLDVFHKGFARAKDEVGWFHINLEGQPIYKQRYLMVEPFYNGFARTEDKYGALLVIDETGKIIKCLREKLLSPLQQLSGELVSYWKTQTIKSAVELGVFDALPAKSELLTKKTGLQSDSMMRLMKALEEIELIIKKDDGFWETTEKGDFLKKNNPLSLSDVAVLWANEHYVTWMHLTEALQKNQPVFEKYMGQPVFDWLDKDLKQLKCYQNAMQTYAEHDYLNIANKLDLSSYNTIIDAAGGQGTLLKNILQKHTHLQGALLERHAVVKQLKQKVGEKLPFEVNEFDLFQAWPIKGDAVFMSRVLHDWNDKKCVKILKHAKNALSKLGVIYLIEMLLDENDSNGGMLDLNMLLIAGGKERTREQFQDLSQQAGLQLTNIIPLDGFNHIIQLEPSEH